MENGKKGIAEYLGKGPESLVEITAKDKDGAVIGTGKVRLFALSLEGEKAFHKRHPLVKERMKLIDRQLKTDARNDLAREKSVMAQLKSARKEAVVQGNTTRVEKIDGFLKDLGITGSL